MEKVKKSIQKKVRYRQGEQRRPNIHIIRDPEDKTKQNKTNKATEFENKY